MRYLLLLLFTFACVQATPTPENVYLGPKPDTEVMVDTDNSLPVTDTSEEFELFSPNLGYCRPGDHLDVQHDAVDNNYYNEWSKHYRWCISEEGAEGSYTYYVVNQAGEVICGFTYRFTAVFREDLTVTHWHYAFEITDTWLHWYDYQYQGQCHPNIHMAPYWRISPEDVRNEIPWELLYSWSPSQGVWYPPWYYSSRYDPLLYTLTARPTKTPDGDMIMRIDYSLMD